MVLLVAIHSLGNTAPPGQLLWLESNSYREVCAYGN